MAITKSEALFKEAVQYIPGGVEFSGPCVRIDRIHTTFYQKSR